MNAVSIGHPEDLFVLPFDHRSSFESGLLGVRGRQPDPQEVQELSRYKRIIYDGFLEALEKGVPEKAAAILVDQTYGHSILADANRRNLVTCVSVEKSGHPEFDFEHGDNFRSRLQEASPTFAKALVRYNPDEDPEVNQRQRDRLKVLSDYVHSAGYKFMFELLVPATTLQLDSVGQDRQAYDQSLRPELTVRAMAELQAAGIEPDVWKLEGTEDSLAARDLVAQARVNGRDRVGTIILGRGEDEKRVTSWLIIAAQTEGVIGFAVGRTVFWQPLVEYKEGTISRDEAVSRIAENYQGFHAIFIDARARAAIPEVRGG